MNQPHFKAHPSGQVETMHREAKRLLLKLPVLRVSIPDEDDDPLSAIAMEQYDVDQIPDPPTAIAMEQEEVDQIPPGQIIELAHLSKIRNQQELPWKYDPTWADHLAVELKLVNAITEDQAPEHYRALYLIRIYAPSWPGIDRDATPRIGRVKRAPVTECSLAYSVGSGLFAELPIRFNQATGKLVLDQGL